ncbi:MULTISPECIES: response regulator [unclassified Pseudoalteromonas]|uniref:response regulator n=1 Tax=unclassified Pseudoalteromonas TaxID=194690 RepID=UPI0005AB0267|nr:MULTISPECIES: response regulator [unclassified Pseudoalteromonas]
MSGLQLLEELNHRNLLKADTILVLITGETAMDLVMGGLEYRPDDYLAKPFTRNSLKAQLDKLMKQNQLLQPIYASINENKPNQVLSLCDVLPLKNKRAAMPCIKIKGDIILKSGKYAKAANIYNSVIEQKKLNWALMGLAKSYAGLDMLPKVKDLSERIICKNKYAPAAYDLLWETYCNLGDYEQAFNLLKTAIEISPNSLIRQMQLGYLALRYLDIENNEIKNIIEQTIGIEQSELFTQENAKKSQNYNKLGMLKFKKKDYVTANNAFRTALLNAPSNANIALNLLQCLYNLALCVQSLENLEPSDHRYTHSQNLFNHIQAQLATQTGKVQ